MDDFDSEDLSSECGSEQQLVKCTFRKGIQNLGTFWVAPDIKLYDIFNYEFPMVEGLRERVALRVTQLQKILTTELVYVAEVEYMPEPLSAPAIDV
jgi:hypothetical protein